MNSFTFAADLVTRKLGHLLSFDMTTKPKTLTNTLFYVMIIPMQKFSVVLIIFMNSNESLLYPADLSTKCLMDVAC